MMNYTKYFNYLIVTGCGLQMVNIQFQTKDYQHFNSVIQFTLIEHKMQCLNHLNLAYWSKDHLLNK
jgi:hypothetical protein